ncbi:NAD-dependent epimerase/dehydratase family protein [Tengunoibacter tsumagoiensis]|uniref:NAD-dependent epimerase/dehydratase domain-containing protein n=1 Tax=Tengunoibacter tsumagoiensis TaxID=2014871 RepID=A0A401ZWB4_9CHLR|nr:NAD-dependent epimerase/dehydratase family protein [Tengunoibacter tsumagoiensis]GCE11147.1 hypothetical protein KTT_10060 [Tengunoibacter tsumagoiensis]
MKFLVLGGTKFLGRHLVEAALARGHEVTLFHRGKTNPQLFPQVESIYGDRTTDLDRLAGRSWDAVLDTSGYVPRIVAATAHALANAAQHYTFISSVNAFAEDGLHNFDESFPPATMEDPTIEEVNGATYGPLKALCEQAVERAFPGRALIIRPGLIVGPADPTNRFSYWPRRMARGGQVLVPNYKEQPIQFIDVRDLAEWNIRLVEKQVTGLFIGVGPDYPLTLGSVLEQCQQVVNPQAELIWVEESFLEDEKVEPWSELPLWLPRSLGLDLSSARIDKALASGLTFRPLAATLRDTLAWEQLYPSDQGEHASLKPAREAELLARWQA